MDRAHNHEKDYSFRQFHRHQQYKTQRDVEMQRTLQEPAAEPIPMTPAQMPVSHSPLQNLENEGNPLHEINSTQKAYVEQAKTQTVFAMRSSNHVLIVDDKTNECFFLKWKTFNKLQRKGKELDPRYFNEQERKAFATSDAKEWKSFIDTGAVVVVQPKDTAHVPKDRIFNRPMRFVRTNKSKIEEILEAKSRIVTPGDVDPDGDIPVEDGLSLIHI